ncbi:DUF2490 domain-containing protein [Chryseobacterium sp. MDT2-18]|uniref:DUF2490 domain-containing protein n=1 Tax=Chryseobacterium sp. MDT2-18 TaxID=1259136 RepID=UPI0027873E95|nr:DUF2490 domain-containing protein [Chryseobacterium sp. MDT2-18]MDQ0475556.1 hypothetical protein [Chryseobacterium sp. MDT2-18]
MKKQVFLILFLAFFSVVNAQREHISSLDVLTVTYKFHPKFYIDAEAQLWGIEDYSYPDYYEIKGGLGYNLSKNQKILIGAGRYGTYKNHRFSKEEFRIWLQDIIELKSGKFKFENRFRVEKSWFYEPVTDLHSDRIRFRYRLNVSVPLNSETVEPGTVSANAYDEVFFILNDNPGFARNRVYAGFSYQIDQTFGVGSGYLWQREFSNSGNKNLHLIYLNLKINIDPSKRKNGPVLKTD